GSINPKLPGWEEDVRRCSEDYKMPGIRLHPNYHGYALTDPVFAELLHLAAGHRLIVQMVLSMEDLRTQHPLMRVPPVDISALPQLVTREPGVRIVLLNWAPALGGARLQPLAEAGAVFFDIATVEGIEGLARLVERLSPDRVLFGSNSPLFYLEAAHLKMQESGLPDDLKNKLFEGNARQLLSRTPP